MPFAGRRYWDERAKLTVKAVLAAVTAWLVAKYVFGQSQPYFAPLAALLGVYPTVVRSVRESLAYGGGFVIGAALAIPVGLLVGPNIAGIALVVVLAMMASGWRRLGYRLRWRDVPGQWPAPELMTMLDHATAHSRPIAATLRRLADADEAVVPGDGFWREYAEVLRALGGLVLELPDVPDGAALAEAEKAQCEMEHPFLGPRTDAPGLWDPRKELLRLSRLLLDDLRDHRP